MLAGRFRTRLVVLGIGCGAAFAAIARTLPSPDLHAPALRAVPAGATLLVVVKPAPFAAKGLWKLPPASAPAKLLARFSSVCGVTALDALDEIAIATPGSAKDGTFALVATGRFRAAPVEACLTRLARDDGRTIERTAAREGQPFVKLHDTSTSGSATSGMASGRPTLALADGVLLAGDASYVDEMIRVLAGQAPSAEDDPLHTGLRHELASGAALAASLRLTADTREAIRREIGDPKAPAGHIVGLLGSVRVGPNVALRGLVACDDEASANALREVIERMAADAEGSITARFLGLVPLLHARATKTEGRAAVIATDTDPNGAAAITNAAFSAWAP